MGIARPDSNQLAFERTELALERTVMAAGRTVMAWARTGLSTISLGFALYKFLQAMKVGGHRVTGEVLIGFGTAAVLLGAIDYVITIQRLQRMYGAAGLVVRHHLVLALLVGILGVTLFLTLVIGRVLG